MRRSRKHLAFVVVTVLGLGGIVLGCIVRHGALLRDAVVDGRARFEVLSPTLIRLEYADNKVFEDRPTYNAVNRSTPAVPYTTSIEGNERVIRTGKLTLRYLRGSGPFTPANVGVQLAAGTTAVTAHPVWQLARNCDYGITCEAELMGLSGGAELANDQTGYTGDGFVDGMGNTGATIAWTQHRVPAAGAYQLRLRYSNASGNGDQSAVVSAGGRDTTIALPPTAGWDTWGEATTTVTLPAGDSPVAVRCAQASSCAFNVDSFAITATGAPLPPVPDAQHEAANLGGWRRSLDLADGPRPLYDGLLSRDGWYLLNDTKTAIAKPDGTVAQRPANPDYQDGYFFGYGHDYRQALKDLHDLTGPAVELPRWALGNWFSRYYPYSAQDYEDTILPAFRDNQVPLDVLVVDTDFKSPNYWNGWEWNPNYFPDPQSFMDWARGQGLRVALNIHPSILASDPRYAQVTAEVGHDLRAQPCDQGTCRVFDLSDPAQLKAYFDLHKSFDALAPIVWWPDTCCDGSVATMPGISPDSWINDRYAAYIDAQGRRGFAWDRSGSGFTAYGESAIYPAGPWADHRYTVDTSMDTISSWDMLAFASYYTIRRGSIGMPYESHDIGAHNYPQDGNRLPQDLYARWVQLGTFQPLLRLHSNHGYRLPWDYPQPARDSAISFMQWREALIPYTYSLAQQAHDTGLPMTRGMYLDYPEFDEAYKFDTQYLFGDDLLVAPVTTPGTENVPTKVWFPPGTWIDYFTGESYTGPSVQTVVTDLSTMPVFLRAGGILPTRTDYVDHSDQKPLEQVTLDLAAGGTGEFRLYEDAGEGHGYLNGEYCWTAIRDETTGTGIRLTISARDGDYPGAVPRRTWTLRLHNLPHAPSRVEVDGQQLAMSGWSYDDSTHTLTMQTSAVPTTIAHTIAVAA